MKHTPNARTARPAAVHPPAATLQPKAARLNWPPVFRPNAAGGTVAPAGGVQRKAAAPGVRQPNWPPVYRALAPQPSVQPKMQPRSPAPPVYRPAATVQRASVIQRGGETGCDPFCCFRPIINYFTRPTYSRVIEMPTFYVAKAMTLSGTNLVKAQSTSGTYNVTPIASDASELNDALNSWNEAAQSSNAQDHVHLIKMVKNHKASFSAAVARDTSNMIQGVVLYKTISHNRVKLEDAVGSPSAKGLSRSLLHYVASQVSSSGTVELVAANENAFGVWGHLGFEAV